ncbi:MAG TPA: outer membrane protein [Pseudolabrys sp.]|jgi:outer membrane immunogenic protein
MKKLLLATAGIAAMAAGMTAASAADLSRRPMPTKAVPYVAPMYNWTGFYLGINGGGAFGGRSGYGGNATGGLVGGTLGYNWQAGQAVFGLETDLDWANIKGSGTDVLGLAVETKNNYLGTVRGRVGYAWDRVMLYATGGLAYGNVKSSSVFGDASSTRAGWTLGGGLEFAVAGPWTAKVEYLYVDLGNAPTAPGALTGGGRFSTNIVRAGLNYRF